jgi:trimethylamine-N-oxide reductase (cytochrome c)
LDANAQLAALKSFSGVVPHATHYGPLLATVEKGRIVKIEAQASDKMPTAMLTEGVLDRTYDKTRVVGAMVRKSYLEWEQNGRKGSNKPELRGKDEWVQVSWDTALGLTAKAILDTIEKYGNEGCFSSSYGGWSHAGIFRPNVLQGRFFNLLGGSSVTTGDYSAGAGQILLPMVIGDMEVYSPQTAWEQLRDNTELVVFIGCDPDKNNRIEYTVCDHEMYSGWDAIKQAGCQFISINPQVTTTDEKMGSEWVRIVPNTDTALFMAMGYHLLSQNKHNQAFIDKYTVGFDKYRAHLEGKDGSAPKTPEWAEKITGIPAAKIRALAELMASKRTQLCGSWAIQRAHHGEMPYWAIVNFACILGNIGLPGQGVGFSWHYGGGGTAQSGGTAPTGYVARAQSGQEDLPGLAHQRDAAQPRQRVHLQRQHLHLPAGQADLQRGQQRVLAPARPQRAGTCHAQRGHRHLPRTLVERLGALGRHRAGCHHHVRAQRHQLSRHLQHRQGVCNEASRRAAARCAG